MSSQPNNPGAIWRSQPGERLAIQLLRRRTGELERATRLEILLAIVAAVFFVAVLASGAIPLQAPWLRIAVVAAALWASMAALRLRRPPAPASLAATGLDHYRALLRRRRDHLQSRWLFNGPLLLAVAVFLLILYQNGVLNPERLRRVLPFLVLLAVWIVLSVVLRRRQAAQIQRELDEATAPPVTPPES